MLGAEAAAFGDRAIVIVDRGIYENIEAGVAAALSGHIDGQLVRHGGECSEDEIARLVEAARSMGAQVVVGVGGGKVLDTAKAAARDLGMPVIVAPTIAASDAPCSALQLFTTKTGR